MVVQVIQGSSTVRLPLPQIPAQPTQPSCTKQPKNQNPSPLQPSHTSPLPLSHSVLHTYPLPTLLPPYYIRLPMPSTYAYAVLVQVGVYPCIYFLKFELPPYK